MCCAGCGNGVEVPGFLLLDAPQPIAHHAARAAEDMARGGETNSIAVPELEIGLSERLLPILRAQGNAQMVSHPQWKVARRFTVSLRHRLPGGWLQSIQDRLQGP